MLIPEASPAEEVIPSGSGSFDYPFTDFSSTVGGTCSAALKCSWDPKTPKVRKKLYWNTNSDT